MTEAERVLAELAALLAEAGLTVEHLPKPEPDRLTVAARECSSYLSAMAQRLQDEGSNMMVYDKDLLPIRAIIAREVAAAEPSDEAIDRVIGLLIVGRGVNHKTVRAALKREGA